MRHNGLTCGSRQQLVSKTDDSSGWNNEFTDHSGTSCFHTGHLSFSDGHHLNRFSRNFFWQVNGQVFHRLTFNSINLLNDNLWLTNLKLVTFSTHGFDQNRKVQYPTAIDQEFICTIGLLYTKRQVFLQFFFQTLLDVTGSNKLSIFTKKRTIVDREKHTHGRLINSNGLQFFWVFDVGNGIANLESFHTNNGTNIPSNHFFHSQTAQTFKSVKFLNSCFYDRTVSFHQRNLLPFTKFTTLQSSDGDSPGK